MKAIDLGASSPETDVAGVRPAHRIWLRDGDTPVFGAGICELLEKVQATGSLRRAASEMGMAYSKAWQIVRRAEEHLGVALMTRHAGGRGGGRSIVSDEGRWLVGAFGAMDEEAEALLDELFARHFGEWQLAAGRRRSTVAGESLRVEEE